MFLLPESETKNIILEKKVFSIGAAVFFILFGILLWLIMSIDNTEVIQIDPLLVSEEESSENIVSSTLEILKQPENYKKVKEPTLVGVLPEPSEFNAVGILVKDVSSGALLYEK